jgi:hypothetical protein
MLDEVKEVLSLQEGEFVLYQVRLFFAAFENVSSAHIMKLKRRVIITTLKQLCILTADLGCIEADGAGAIEGCCWWLRFLRGRGDPRPHLDF